jgi:AraC family transcriptional regulator, regulatory protein of adaptative response / methylated-DNA-[protein]-cysteine methyltransferase
VTTKDTTYETIAEAIRFLRAHFRQQPSLEAVAKHVGISPHHLQRIFSEWAGISPKRFLQFVTKENARNLLRHSRNVLSAALDSGLSGPGRLHDLMVSCEALTPGQVGALGEGLTIRFGFASTPLGNIIAGISPRGVCHLMFIEAGMGVPAEQMLFAEWPQADFRRDDAAAGNLAATVLGALKGSRPVSLLLRGTNFQIKVWEALLHVPPGLAVSYGDLAERVGAPGGPRAVGTALARNSLAVLIPCHRVIRETGDFGQYRWGPERKIALLAREQSKGSRHY